MGRHSCKWAKLAVMAKPPSLWLVGVRKDDVDHVGKPRFLSQLQYRFRGRELERQGRLMLIRNVPDAGHVRDLQNQYGKEYVQFYYVEETLMKAIKLSGIKVQFLQLVVGPPEGDDVYATITLPSEY